MVVTHLRTDIAKAFLLSLATIFGFLFVMWLTTTKADARSSPYGRVHHARLDASGNFANPSVKRSAGHYKHTKRYKKKKRIHDVGVALAVIESAEGITTKVVASAQEQFQTLIRLVEADTVYPERPDLNAKGNRIKDMGGYAPRGHAPFSKHRWGGALDIDQTARNRTSGFMYHVTTFARWVGLTDGATWGGRGRYGGPDAGHVEVPGPNSPRLNKFAQESRNVKLAGRQ